MKKIFSILLLGVLLCLAACASTAERTEVPSAPASDTASDTDAPTAQPSAHEHTFDLAETAEPTCTADGYERFVCVDCGEESRGVLSKIAHTAELETTAEPACEKPGEQVEKCSVCGEILDRIPLPALAHIPLAEVTAEATCSAPGLEVEICTLCGEKIGSRELAVLPHSYREEQHAGTCLAKGYTLYTCQDCGDSYTEITGAYGDHTYKASDTAATCTRDGVHKEVCSVCGDTKTATLPKTGHHYQTAEQKDATCTEDGYTKYRCGNCGDSYTESTAAKGHTPGDKTWDEYQKGVYDIYCLVCKRTLETGTIFEDKEYTVDLGDGKTTTVKGHFDAEYEDEVLQMLNDHRAANGLPPLQRNDTLADSCRVRGCEITVKWGHERPNGKSCFSVPGPAYGENIAKGYRTPAAVMSGWKDSDGHNKNMLAEGWTEAGIGCFVERLESADGSGRFIRYEYHWVQLFK